MPSVDSTRAYVTTLEPMPRTKARVPVPFDPNEVWGSKREHRVGGTGPGDRVDVVIWPEGPQRGDLAPDVGA